MARRMFGGLLYRGRQFLGRLFGGAATPPPVIDPHIIGLIWDYPHSVQLIWDYPRTIQLIWEY